MRVVAGYPPPPPQKARSSIASSTTSSSCDAEYDQGFGRMGPSRESRRSSFTGTSGTARTTLSFTTPHPFDYHIAVNLAFSLAVPRSSTPGAALNDAGFLYFWRLSIRALTRGSSVAPPRLLLSPADGIDRSSGNGEDDLPSILDKRWRDGPADRGGGGSRARDRQRKHPDTHRDRYGGGGGVDGMDGGRSNL